jgi:hypothetical protein
MRASVKDATGEELGGGGIGPGAAVQRAHLVLWPTKRSGHGLGLGPAFSGLLLLDLSAILLLAGNRLDSGFVMAALPFTQR